MKCVIDDCNTDTGFDNPKEYCNACWESIIVPLSRPSQLDRIEQKLDELLSRNLTPQGGSAQDRVTHTHRWEKPYTGGC